MSSGRSGDGPVRVTRAFLSAGDNVGRCPSLDQVSMLTALMASPFA